MGRAAFHRFLTAPSATGGVRWGGEHATWRDLAAHRVAEVRPGGAYLVDPSVGLASVAALLAVASVPDTTLLWATPDSVGAEGRRIAPGLHHIGSPLPSPTDRPLWGVATSGSSGTAKIAIGHADAWELVALHYERAMFQPAFDGRTPQVLATCLPLQFSAAFFMVILPGLFLQRDVVVFPPHDWASVAQAARDAFVLSVPAVTAAACVGTAAPVDMRHVSLFLGGGHVTKTRVDLIRDRFRGVSLANLYGTAETGAIAVDHDPGHNQHVGQPIPGKTVWIDQPDERGVGRVAVAGPDCCRYLWRPGQSPQATGDHVASTDYGRLDAAGNLCLEGRVDGGEKLRGVLVYPRAIERHLLVLPGVSDARVLVERRDSGLERLVARIVGDVDPAAVHEHCRSLAELERPADVQVFSEQAAGAAYNAHGKLR
ncbi:AMP-binding protein [Micromonospora carbonacea]|uniref:AMP-binding protein n=1 Tax=Micromonospora carbonacea TaxID=47853 RepID=A0A7H8XTD4_9ACTN|nr:AMP-binding protein [Micromonospora carbonacea]MBB5830116.1 acyl-coenzyme A synthetase/AMP-(fatty) acid ligase [Micromonospora carbonacea]QLD27964.1 AMP-binding protein [Micromonospora carbonacea]